LAGSIDLNVDIPKGTVKMELAAMTAFSNTKAAAKSSASEIRGWTCI